ncbi:MAG: hypothetical protein ACLRVT_06590 [Oscillospiraceae bacterium]
MSPVQPDSASKSITQMEQQLMELFSQLENFKWLEHTDEIWNETYLGSSKPYAQPWKTIRRLE